jgi:hypothetical protein
MAKTLGKVFGGEKKIGRRRGEKNDEQFFYLMTS